MWNISINHCPYDHWEAVAKSACSTSEQFHCLKDEFERIGWLCTQPMWVEGGRCPVYNSEAGLLNTIECIGEGCPSSSYLSNDVHFKHSCRLDNLSDIIGDKNTTYTTEVNTSTQTDNYMYIFGAVGVALILVIIGAIILLRRRRQQFHPQEHDGEEHIPLIVSSSTKFSEAENYLKMNHCVALIGIEGSGRTHLAKRLAECRKKCEICWINDILNYKLDTHLSERKVVILDDIFYVLQNENEVKLVASKVEDLYQKKQSPYIIVTVPSYIWERHADTFSNKESFKWHVDLNNLCKEEREHILREHLDLNDIRDEENAKESDLFMRNEVKSAIIGSANYKSIGFPSFVAWISKMRNQNDIHEAGSFIQFPISYIRSEVHFLRKSIKNEEKKMFLLLAYAALSGGILDSTQIDKEFLHLLATTHYPNDDHDEFLLDFDRSLLALEEKYIRIQAPGKYEFQQDVVRKIIFVVAIEQNINVLKGNVSEHLLKRHAVERDAFPIGFDNEVARCFVKL